jgi:myo-inositol 2-dehydrogenase/D-chiro-inositol 1-dehydrogenase
MGSFHAKTLARRIPDAQLVAVADPAPGAAERLAAALGARATTDTTDLLDDPWSTR